MRIEGQGAFVTGGASGLGAATARLLADAGARVMIFDRDGEGAARLAEELGGRCAAGDVTSEADVEAALDAAGEVRLVVNCAGIGPPRRIVGRDGTHPLDLFQTVIDVNLVGTFNVMRLAAARIHATRPAGGRSAGRRRQHRLRRRL